jgi:hypothetical protein
MVMTVQEENAAMDALRSPLEINYKLIQPCDEFQRLANKLGTHFAAPLTQLRLEECLRDNAIAVYPIEKVRQFMDAKVDTIRRLEHDKYIYKYIYWGWFPLRGVDRDRPSGIGPGNTRVYQKAVPVEVLMTVEKIMDRLDHPHVRFYVADVEKIRIDPFLCVTARGCPVYVIERWDEPAFRE